MRNTDALREFLRPFKVKVPPLTWIGRRAFLVSEELQRFADGLKVDLFALGVPMGETTSKGFRPSFALLDLLKDSPSYIVIADEAEWLFLCGRDVFMDKIVDEGEIGKVFLIKNVKDEVLGLGAMSTKGRKTFVKNLLDRGDFLRREERRKKRK